MDKIDTEERLKKAQRWSKIAPEYHRFYGGKVEVMPKCSIRSLQDFSIWYTCVNNQPTLFCTLAMLRGGCKRT